MSLRPQNLIQAALADLKRREHNEAVYAGLKHGEIEQFAFHRKHVERSESAGELLLLALMDYGVLRTKDLLWTEKTAKYTSQIGTVRKPAGQLMTAKKNTKIIYSDGALLIEALRLLPDYGKDQE